MSTTQIIKLACPIDAEPLEKKQKEYSCINGHTFDIAKQGYVNLLPVQHKRSKQPGDSKEMVLARKSFLNSGIYKNIANTLTEIISSFNFTEYTKLLDAGCGEGYYLDYIYNAFHENAVKFSFIGLDISKLAIAEAAKRNRDITWVVGTNRSPPVCANSIDIIICVFGFYSFEGFNKALKPGGKIILVEPGTEHLNELREIIYTDVKRTSLPELSAATKLGVTLSETHYIKYNTGNLNKEQINQLLLMTPHFFRANKAGRDRASQIESLDLTVDMIVRVLEKEL